MSLAMARKITCGKCGKEFIGTTFVFVSPITEDGINLDRVYLCGDCLALWEKSYRKVSHKDPSWKKNFNKNWVKTWKDFLKGKFDKEEVEFT